MCGCRRCEVNSVYPVCRRFHLFMVSKQSELGGAASRTVLVFLRDNT